jgi:hypothetical protein
MWRIFVPLKYLLISHAEKKKFDVYLPLIICILFSTPLLSENFRNEAVDTLDVIGKISGFLGLLTGFFIAALAAVATFGRDEMDEPMSGDSPVVLMHQANGVSYPEHLTRRRFLSFLFGYLACSALFSYILGFAYIIFEAYFVAAILPSAKATIFSFFWLAYMFIIGNLLSNTLLGLFYLSDRMHRQNRTLTYNRQDDAA